MTTGLLTNPHLYIAIDQQELGHSHHAYWTTPPPHTLSS